MEKTIQFGEFGLNNLIQLLLAIYYIINCVKLFLVLAFQELKLCSTGLCHKEPLYAVQSGLLNSLSLPNYLNVHNIHW